MKNAAWFKTAAGVCVVAACSLGGGVFAQQGPAYKDPSQPVEARVADLLSRMSPEQKARQLDMYFGAEDFLNKSQTRDRTHAKADAIFNPEKAAKTLGNLGAGSIHDLYPHPALYNALQNWVIKSNPLGIPALFLEEGLHGYQGYDETIFPQTVNLASTWNPDLARATGAAIGAEARACGVDMILAPVLDVALDPRWGRVEEDFGEDPYLGGVMGLNYVQGMQGDSLASDHNTIAEPKHFAGHGSPESGLNTSPVHAGEREVRSVMLKTFEPAIRVGHAGAVMVAYHDIDGVPCTANAWLLNDVLRDEWGFQGFALSDLGAIRRLWEDHHVAATAGDAVRLALNSGVDMQFYDFPHDVFQGAIVDGVKDGSVTPETLDRAVGRVLRAKFMLGLFDKPFVDESADRKARRSAGHLATSLQVARESICLLKNEDNLLPLRKDLRRIAFIGTNANITRLGDYADTGHEGPEHSMVAESKKLVSPNTEITYDSGDDIDAAVAAAKSADAVVLGLGEWHGISGEGSDRDTLGLPGKQEGLLEAVVAAGKPVVLVLQNGRALAIPWAAAHVPAILEAWYPGEFGGQAIAETLFGDNNPSGKLPVSFPRSVGQLPVFYDYFPSKNDHYVEGEWKPVFHFGHGLSYTTFSYANVTATPAEGGDGDIEVSFDLANTGARAGDEVAQVYVRRTTASVATPIKALKGFARVHLEAGQSKRVTIPLHRADLAVWGANRQWSVEPGEINVMVGGSSQARVSAKFVLK